MGRNFLAGTGFYRARPIETIIAEYREFRPEIQITGRDPQELWSVLVHREAEEVAKNNTRVHTAQVAECFFLHMLKLCCMGCYNFKTDYDLATHACNYWMCEGIMQQLQRGALGVGDTSIVDIDGNEESWRTADSLQREIQLDVDYYNYNYKHQYFPSHLVRYGMTMPCWSSPYGFMLVPVGAIPNVDMLLQDFNSLTVLKLSRRTLSFTSPPFLNYHKLKFLWLDHCEDQEVSTIADFPNEEKNKKISTDNRALKEAFQKLWVLDVRYTCCDWILSAQMMDFMTQLRELNVMGAQDWDMGQLHGRLPNIRKLRVTKSSIRCSSCLGSYLFSEMYKMELLDLSGSSISPLGTSFPAGPGGSNNIICNVVTVIIDGFIGCKEISLRGCANLKNLFLSGVLQDLYSLDISGTSVKTLDLSATTAPNLDELYLLGCEKLCAILWPPQGKRKQHLKKLHIDTNTQLRLTTPPGDENNKEAITSGATAETSSFSVLRGGKAPNEFGWYISVRDVRFLFCLEPMRSYFDGYWHAHVEISSPTCYTVDAGGSIQSKHNEGNKSISMYADVVTSIKYHLQQAREGRGDDAPAIITETWPCPDVPFRESLNCYMSIHDKIRANKSPLGVEETMTSIAMPDFIRDGAWSLHVHDALYMASIPGPAPGAVGGRWNQLSWCRVERCPNLDSVFTTPLQVAQGGKQADGYDAIFWNLGIFWGSQLPNARFIWNWGTTSSLFRFSSSSFNDLRFLHLDLCPRLIHVLPLRMSIMRSCLWNLVTLEIVWCSDLKEIFPSYHSGAKSSDMQQESMYVVTLQYLKHIHLQELPRLRGICGGGNARLGAPNLETIKIRGCWSLRRLPALGSKQGVVCDCEKEWWDNLEWDGLEADHHPSLYKPIHPRYYKKRMLRGSVLV